MTENSKSNRQSLSDISHLFLAEQREKHTGERPVRKPPASNMKLASTGRPSSVSIDITPREFASGLELSAADHAGGGFDEQDDSQRLVLSAVVAHHLDGLALARVRDYARHIAAGGARVGLVELGDDGLRVTCFEKPDADADMAGDSTGGAGAEAHAQVEPVDGPRIGEALEELSWDVQRWLVYLPSGARSTHARDLLAQLPRWTLLASADDEGMINAYRALKGLSGVGTPALSLAVAGADDGAQAEIIHRKLAGASKQFLGRPIELEGLIAETEGISAHGVLWCRASGATQSHWTAVAEWAGKAIAPESAAKRDELEIADLAEPIEDAQPEPAKIGTDEMDADEIACEFDASAATDDLIEPQGIPGPIPISAHVSTHIPAEANMRSTESDISDVLDLPADATAAAILAAVMSQQSQWVACPVKPPMSVGGSDVARMIAVDRQGCLALLAVAGSGLADLRMISRGYSWLLENRELIRMAVPQMNIDAGTLPKLTLFVDEAGASGEQLAAIFGGGNVTVQTYRRLRWGGKTGLLLAA